MAVFTYVLFAIWISFPSASAQGSLECNESCTGQCRLVTNCSTCKFARPLCLGQDSIDALNKDGDFNDAFCGNKGAVLYYAQGAFRPLKCRINGLCPDMAVCRTSDNNNHSYCCYLPAGQDPMANGTNTKEIVSVSTPENLNTSKTTENNTDIANITILNLQAQVGRQRPALTCGRNCSDDNLECRLVASCKICNSSLILCVRRSLVDVIFQRNNFREDFCGSQGVVIYIYRRGEFLPLKCFQERKCPERAVCKTSFTDGKDYCCARVSAALYTGSPTYTKTASTFPPYATDENQTFSLVVEIFTTPLPTTVNQSDAGLQHNAVAPKQNNSTPENRQPGYSAQGPTTQTVTPTPTFSLVVDIFTTLFPVEFDTAYPRRRRKRSPYNYEIGKVKSDHNGRYLGEKRSFKTSKHNGGFKKAKPRCMSVVLSSAKRDWNMKKLLPPGSKSRSAGARHSIISVAVVLEPLSSVECLEGVNFFYVDRTLLVGDGCSALFLVCFKTLPVSTSTTTKESSSSESQPTTKAKTPGTTMVTTVKTPGVTPITKATSPAASMVTTATSPLATLVTSTTTLATTVTSGTTPRSTQVTSVTTHVATAVNPATTPGPTPVNPATTPGPIPVNPATTPVATPVNPATTPGLTAVNPKTTPVATVVNPATNPGPTPVNPATTPGPTPVHPATTPGPKPVTSATTPEQTPLNPVTTPEPTPVIPGTGRPATTKITRGSTARRTTIVITGCRTLFLRSTVTKDRKVDLFGVGTFISIDLLRQVDEMKCIRGITFDFNDTMAMVSGGCAGFFKICQKIYFPTTAFPVITTTVTEAEAMTNPPQMKTTSLPSNASQTGQRSSSLIDLTRASVNSGSTVPTVTVVNQSQAVESEEATTKQSPTAGTINRLSTESGTSSTGIPTEQPNGVSASASNLTNPTTATSSTRQTNNNTTNVQTSQFVRPPEYLQCLLRALISNSTTADIVTIFDNQQIPADIRYLELSRAISPESLCEKGESFSYISSVIIAKSGCQGIFHVCFLQSKCELLELLSGPADAPEFYEFRPEDKESGEGPHPEAIIIRSVSVDKQIGVLPCIKWESFYHTTSKIIVRDGCHAVFKVCYVEEPLLD
ncbi:hypothetical protein PoB_002410300 [Plakobranchus ocellatus]|uniref:Uncharacterized protein n=1 Tax=Plakobranchus ocellatus TaxID=259542 RepID=A0AAV3ZT17_9GAST|nr:hypothetical protein PoB_002410300 [Plakobranchus ocellatus]